MKFPAFTIGGGAGSLAAVGPALTCSAGVVYYGRFPYLAGKEGADHHEF